ncbi:high-affinity iron permease [Spiromyces aspiralis]|uniref:High-affinity iron permease n=1 Tax=Spiromyces aspiralis TaxID=68401 RepID=A0ACC1HJZ9_9FUNG|nr:high-affinity iron permease [Spiromyces aspiralis]
MGSAFSVPIFFIIFRETTEAALIISIMMTFAKQVFADDRPVLKRLMIQIWAGAIIGFVISLIIGIVFIVIWYTVAKDLWSSSEALWEAIFALIAAILITLMGVAFVRTQHLQNKLKIKLHSALEKNRNERGFFSKYAFVILPLITVLREGLEAVVFVGGVSLGESAKSIPLATICGILAGAAIGLIIYKGGNVLRLKWFFVASTLLLFLIAGGLFASCINYFQNYRFGKLLAGGDPDAGYIFNVKQSVWMLTCCNPADLRANGGWKIFSAILGWTNNATVGSVVGYCLYWVCITLYFLGSKLWARKQYRRDLIMRGKVADL